MEPEESLHEVFTELRNLRKKLADIEEQKQILKRKKFVSQLEEKLDKFSSLIKEINEHQETINNKKTTLVFKMPEKSISTNSNSLQLAYTHHDDFMNIILSKPKIEKLVHDTLTSNERNTDLKVITNEFKEINSYWRNQYFEQFCEFRSSKGLMNNIEQLKEIDKNNKDESNKRNDSDLGCYPNDSNCTEENVTLLQFATSSPM